MYLHRIFLLESAPNIPADWVTDVRERELRIEDNVDGGTGNPLLESYMHRPEYGDSARDPAQEYSHYTWRREKGHWVIDSTDDDEPAGGFDRTENARGTHPISWTKRKIEPGTRQIHPAPEFRLHTLTDGAFISPRSRRNAKLPHLLHIIFLNEATPDSRARTLTNPPDWAWPCTEVTGDGRYTLIGLSFARRFPKPQTNAPEFPSCS